MLLGRDWNPLEKRTFRYKNPAMEFFCPLCRTKRAMTIGPHLSALNYAQIVLVSSALIAILFPLMQFKSFFIFFVVWAAFEAVRRLLFRREIPCPHCGFDASWYKRDVKVARRKVAEFWASKNAENSLPDEMPIPSGEILGAQPPQESNPYFS